MSGKSKHADELTTILECITEGVFTVDNEMNITSFNRISEELTGIPREEAMGKPCCNVLHTSICESECALKQTIESNKPIIARPVYIINKSGRRVPVTISTALLKDTDGKIIGGVETFRDISLVEELRKEIELKYTFEDIISRSPAIKEIFNIIPTVAQSDTPVLIEGESGTGKELLVRAIHRLSHRNSKPLVSINCGALPDSLLESELFGYKKGAFTDAKQDKPGRFALAHTGTIFLDEIGEISPAMQVKLLRVLQEKSYEPLGSTKSENVDVRVIAATNQNLIELVETKEFRLDLYYRLNIMRFEMPPLRDRLEDIPLLVDHFISKFNKLYGKSIAIISPDALALLMKHSFPGNVRELENSIEHAFVLCTGSVIQPQHLPHELHKNAGHVTIINSATTLDEVEAQFIESALKRNEWNRLKTANELGIHKTTLFRKIKKLEIKLPEKDGRYKA